MPLVKKIINIGITEETNLWLAGRIRIVNFFTALSLSLLSIVIVLVFFLLPQIINLLLLFAAINVLTLFLNQQQKHNLSRLTFVAACYSTICILAILFGPTLHFQYFIIPSVGIPLILFRNEIGFLRWILTYAGLPIWGALEWWFKNHEPVFSSILDDFQNYRYINDCFLILTSIFLFRIFTNESEKHIDIITETNEELGNLATKDPLTQLYNRRFIDEHLKKIFEEYRKDDLSIVFLMIDADHFKAVNDTYGHDVGDLMLENISNVLTTILRESDVIGRLGGDEFCVILTYKNKAKAIKLIHRLHESLSNITINYNGKSIPMSCSVGAAFASKNTDRPEALIKNADKALYQAKEKGRNQACIFED